MLRNILRVHSSHTDCVTASRNASDPFLYRDASGAFHSLHHAYPKPFGPHAFSPDGLSWYTYWSGANITQHEAYMDEIVFDDGSVVRAGCRERPSLVFAEDGTTPIALMNGLSQTFIICTSHLGFRWLKISVRYPRPKFRHLS